MSYLHLSNHLQLSCPTRLHCIFDPIVKRTWTPTTGSPMSDNWLLGRTCLFVEHDQNKVHLNFVLQQVEARPRFFDSALVSDYISLIQRYFK